MERDPDARALFVTAAGTEIGKTLVTAALVHQLREAGRPVRALKPVISGLDEVSPADSDSGRLLAALGRPVNADGIAKVSPWRFGAPLSPHMAAAAEGREIDFDALVAFCQAEADACAAAGETLLIEGVGGAMVPVTTRKTVLDWIAALGLPAVLVGGSYLGALSHTLTAARALECEGIAIAAAVIGESGENDVGLAPTVETLRGFLPTTPVVALPRIRAAGAVWRAAPPLLGPILPGQSETGSLTAGDFRASRKPSHHAGG
ncbi:MAG: dethiobiotin synthase [Defluviicoccus sp.]|nr:dethiobiotin synthase [Defluviicoccus sp.]MDE0386244.1 dethiobiotin synthase [Defluviicoccus sp.]